jgi:hypothetical protein
MKITFWILQICEQRTLRDSNRSCIPAGGRDTAFHSVSPLAGVGTELKAPVHTAEHHYAGGTDLLPPEPLVGDDNCARSVTHTRKNSQILSHMGALLVLTSLLSEI